MGSPLSLLLLSFAHTATVLPEGALEINGFGTTVLIFHSKYPQAQRFYRAV